MLSHDNVWGAVQPPSPLMLSSSQVDVWGPGMKFGKVCFVSSPPACCFGVVFGWCPRGCSAQIQTPASAWTMTPGEHRRAPNDHHRSSRQRNSSKAPSFPAARKKTRRAMHACRTSTRLCCGHRASHSHPTLPTVPPQPCCPLPRHHITKQAQLMQRSNCAHGRTNLTSTQTRRREHPQSNAIKTHFKTLSQRAGIPAEQSNRRVEREKKWGKSRGRTSRATNPQWEGANMEGRSGEANRW